MIWRASGIPEVYLNDHPVLNQLFYMYLRTIWNNPAVVPVVQIVATALLVAFAFNKMRRAGVASALLLPFYLLILFALPLHLYNIVLWKDIPYALMVTVWGFFFVFTYSRKDANRWRFSVRQWGGLLLAYLALCFFRHNGLVYLVVVPFFWLLLGPYAWRKGLGYFFFSLLVAAGLLWTMSHIRTFGGLSFLSTSLQQHTMFLQQTTLPREAMRVGSGFFQVFDMEKEKTVSDKWHYYLEDRYSWNYLQQTGLSDYYPYVDRKPYFPKLRQAILEVYRASYEKPWQYFLWNPFHMLIFVPFVLLGFRWFPSAAIFSGFLLCGVIPLLVINIFNWRYYYFFYFGLYFILPLMFFDIRRKRGGSH
ncbi:MAG: hypothetical protein HGB26_02015 [Desulfobulbaceae bacterium]|nr:hypothetical protein [Desulfobulbaceae bacterium]